MIDDKDPINWNAPSYGELLEKISRKNGTILIWGIIAVVSITLNVIVLLLSIH